MNMEILLAAHSAADEVYLLQSAAKILAELQVICPGWRLAQANMPWQLRLVGDRGEMAYIKNQICDILDGRRTALAIKELP